MGGKKRSERKILERDIKEPSVFSNYSAPARNIRKTDLGAVIFGCKHSTIHECLSRNLFGLPASHFSYIKNIKEGLALFLFNYSDRKLHGIFEASSPGQMNINRCAWVGDNDTEFTNYPAQVRVRVRQQCHPLSEDQFGPVIAENYYEKQHFYFELDHSQTKKLMSLFKPSNSSASSTQIPIKCNNLSSSYPVLAKNNNQNISTTTTATTSQYTVKWSALFKTESTSEAITEDEWPRDEKYDDKADLVQTNAWGDAECDKTWESDWNSDGEVPFEQHEDKVANAWEESDSKLVQTSINEAECVQTCEPDLNHETNTNKDKLPLSSSQPLDDNPDRQVSSSSETSESDGEEKLKEDNSVVPNTVEEINSVNLESLVVKLKKKVEVMKESQMKNVTYINLLEQQLDNSKIEIEKLRNRIHVLESGSRSVEVNSNNLQTKSHSQFSNCVFIVGGYDGCSWLPSVESYFPSYDLKLPPIPMNSVKKYSSAASMNCEIYLFGDMESQTVESFNLITNQWVSRPPSYWKNINVAGASVNNKLLVVGGSKGSTCSSEVEYLDLHLGKWLPIQSMNSKRLAPAAAELNNALYVTGGYDGESYSSSVERLDPREEKWTKLADMNKRKGSHSMVVLNEKLYTLGGFDGKNRMQTVEYFDTRMGCWVESDSMNVCRGYFGAFVLGETLYAIGGVKENNQVLDIVECYKEGSCWEVAHLKGIGKRSHFSAIVLWCDIL